MQKILSNRKTYLSFALVTLVAVAIAGCGLSGGGLAPSTTLNKNSNNLVLDGYDAVAYFRENLPREGKPEFTADYSGGKWQFVSAENRDMFQKDPEKYVPQYGGYCAWAVGQGYTADTDPQTGQVVDGKLYLNYNPEVATKWNQDNGKFIADGDKNWLTLSGKAEESRKDK